LKEVTKIATVVFLILICTIIVFSKVENKESDLHGFRVVSDEKVEELNGRGILYEHIKSKGKVLYIKNEDKNRSFSINIKTMPKNNRGTNHVIEHCIAQGGSEHYPVKSSIDKAKNNSMCESLMIYTKQDRVTYCASSYVENDIYNMMDVTLDAVFFSNLVKDPNILKTQRGLFCLDDIDEEIVFRGNVYSEMKGMQDSELQLQKAITKSLFSKTDYRWDVGGIPKDIMKLTKEEVIKTYEKQYVPSNCYIIVYGKVDIEKVLTNLNKYFSHRKFEQVNNENVLIQRQTSNKEVEYIEDYGVAEDKDTTNKTYITYNYVVGDIKDKEGIFVANIINRLLKDDIDQLKKQIQSQKLGKDVYSELTMEGIQPIYTIKVLDSDIKNKLKIQELIDDLFTKRYQNGFAIEQIDNLLSKCKRIEERRCLNTVSHYRINQDICRGWVHGENIFDYIRNEDTIESIENNVEKGCFKEFIKREFIDNKHRSIVVLNPVKGLAEQKARKTKEYLKNYKVKLSKNELEKLVEDTKSLNAWIDKSSSKNDENKIPKLTLEDIKIEMDDISTQMDKLHGVSTIYHPMNIDGFSQISLYFDTDNVVEDELCYVKLLCDVLGKLETIKNNKEQISEKRKKYPFVIMPEFHDKSESNIKGLKICMSMKMDKGKCKDILNFKEEIINSTLFKDKESIKNILVSIQSDYKTFIKEYDYGKYVASNSVKCQGEKYSKIWGDKYRVFINNLLANYDNQFDNIERNLREVNRKVFNTNNMTISFTGSNQGYEEFKSNIGDLISKINNKKEAKSESIINKKNRKATIMPIDTSYVVVGGNFIEEGYKYDPKMKVLENIINNEYIKQLRIKGYAYDANINISEDGDITISVDRCDDIKKTLEIIDSVVKFIENFTLAKDQMHNHIVSTIPKILKRDEFDSYIFRYKAYNKMLFAKQSIDKRIQQCNQIKTTKDKDIKKYAKMLKAILDQNNYCITGGKDIILKNKGLFDEIEYFK